MGEIGTTVRSDVSRRNAVHVRRPPRVAVVGCGEWGKNIVRDLSCLGALHSLSDIVEPRSAKFAREFNVAARSLKKTLEDDAVEAVAIATPAPQHAEHVRAALNAGKHVFVEKPLALTVADAESLLALARRRKRVLMVGHLLQYHPLHLALLEHVRSGELGEIQHVFSNRLNMGRVRHEENVVWSLAPHDVSVILALVGEMPCRVSVESSNILDPVISDVATIHLDFPTGLKARVFVSWLNPYKEQRLVVIGSKGQAVLDDTLAWDERLTIYNHTIDSSSGRPVARKGCGATVSVPEVEPLKAELAHFLECVVSGETPRTDAAEALRVIRVLEAAANCGERRLGNGKS